MQVIDSMATQTGLLAASDTSLGRRRAAALLCRPRRRGDRSHRRDGAVLLAERGARRRLLTRGPRVWVTDKGVLEQLLGRGAVRVLDLERLLEKVVGVCRDVVGDRGATRRADLQSSGRVS